MAKDLLRGCLQHFRAGVTRIKKISGVVPPNHAVGFEARALGLLKASDKADFQRRAQVLLRDFPKTEPWLRWWMRDTHAAMLFESERRMDPAIWDSIPETTNAEEAMHWKLYAAAGRNHALMEGLCALSSVAAYFERLYTASLRTYFMIYLECMFHISN